MADKQISDLTGASAMTDGSLFVIEQGGAAMSANWGMDKNYISPGVAAQYSTSATYNVGDYVIHNGQLYRCIIPITTPETWTAAHWASTYVSNELTRDNSQLSDIYLNTVNNALLGFGENKYTYELGGISSTTGFDNVNNTRIRTIGMFFATKGTVISHPSDDRLVYVMLYDMDGSYSGSSGGWVKTYTITQNCMVRIVARKSASNPTISVSDIPTIVADIDIAYAQMHPLALSRAFTPSATKLQETRNKMPAARVYMIKVLSILLMVDNGMLSL